MIVILGYTLFFVLVFFVSLVALSYVLKIEKIKTHAFTANTLEMPKLQPVPILTNVQASAIHKLVAYVTQVRRWQLLDNWHYEIAGTTYVIPQGFVFDGASIPRPLWGILSPTGLLLIPSLLHDFAYRYDYRWALDAEQGYVKQEINAGRAHWDALFLKIGTKVNGMALVTAIAWLAISTMGWISWRAHQKNRAVEIYPHKKLSSNR